ncbi:Glutathione S-transferase omega-like 2 [Cladobotryum mycophilum]|uniref:Glutathione S-transferase omega-like 2 n=1 Tax=Cladobotryum mycophilum TaxID=491253 RepID=A0ABR0S8S7_9HYPO
MSTDSKITDWVKPDDNSGEFKRQVSSFRERISREPGAQFPRKRAGIISLLAMLVHGYAISPKYTYLPYSDTDPNEIIQAHRSLIVRKLKGLEDFISFSVVHWHLGQKGWRFVTKDEKEPGENVIPDPIEGHESFTHLREVFFESNKDYSGRFTVPVLYDKKTKQIVNNESSEIIRMLGTEFDDLIEEKYRSVSLYPEDLRSQIDEANTWTYDLINNGVYKAGFATTAEAYERNVVALFEALDRTERHFNQQKEGPYYFGNTITEADIRLYVTLIRFDPVYVQHFKCNIRDIRSGYPHLHKWMRNLYWNVPAFHDTTQFEHIKWHYTRSHTQINPLSITPLGPLPHILPLDEEVAAVTRL